MQIACLTDVGNTRDNNQDYVNFKKLNDEEVIGIICDGMGGHKAGEVASEMAGDYILNHFINHDPFHNIEDIEEWIKYLIDKVNENVMIESNLHEEYKGMGTTIVVVYIYENRVYISHVGDSRAYVYDEDLKQITEDDTLVNELVKNGYISYEDSLTHPQKNILIQAIGVSVPLKISFYHFEFQHSLLVCSDGLYNSLNNEEIKQILSLSIPTKEKVNKLVEEAKQLGGYDNISVLLIEKGV